MQLVPEWLVVLWGAAIWAILLGIGHLGVHIRQELKDIRQLLSERRDPN
jgi:hypothetical protein